MSCYLLVCFSTLASLFCIKTSRVLSLVLNLPGQNQLFADLHISHETTQAKSQKKLRYNTKEMVRPKSESLFN